MNHFLAFLFFMVLLIHGASNDDQFLVLVASVGVGSSMVSIALES